MFIKYLKYLVICMITVLSVSSCHKELDVEPCCGDQVQLPDEPIRPVPPGNIGS